MSKNKSRNQSKEINDKNDKDYDDIENSKNNTYVEITSTSTSTGISTRTIINVTIAFQS